MGIRFVASVPETAAVGAEVACAKKFAQEPEAVVLSKMSETQFDRQRMASVRRDDYSIAESPMRRCCRRGEESQWGLQGRIL